MATSLPEIVSRDEWNAAHKEFRAREKQATRAQDTLNADRRRLPMVEIDKEYVFQGAAGEARLLDLFDGRRQLIVYHFMFHPDWTEGCPACSFLVDNFPHHVGHLNRRDTSLAVVSRAPWSKLRAYQERMGWSFPWYSSEGSHFNYDFHVTLDEAVAPIEHNFYDRKGLEQMGVKDFNGVELPGVSVFLLEGERIFHTYSTYSRGGEAFLSTYRLLDLTALGRQEDWEEPKDRHTGPTKGFLRHDKY